MEPEGEDSMRLKEFGVFCLLFVVPYTIVLQILLITFITKYIDARRELARKMKENNDQGPSAPAQAPVPVSVPAPAPVVSPAVMPVPQPIAPAPVQKQKKKKISSTSIIFGVGVLLLTIVGASFLSVSWGFMGDAARAFTLIAAVAVVYLLSFISGRLLKLKQTGFAFYTLAGFLGPIVIVGVGMFRLFGNQFSFKSGNGWIVAAVAAALMALSASLGKIIYKSHFYTGITYFSFTWLIAFIAGQIGEYSETAYPVEVIFTALSLLTLILCIITLTGRDSLRFPFRLYTEIMVYLAPVLMFIATCSSDNYSNVFLLTGALFTNAELILWARFAPHRNWLKYVTPIASFGLYAVLSMNLRFPDEIWKIFALYIALYSVYFFLKTRTLVSDIIFTSFLAFTVLGYDLAKNPRYLPVIIAMAISCLMSFLSSSVSKNKAVGGINAALAGAWYYIMSVELMLKLIGDNDETLYFLLVLPIPIATSLALILLKRFWKDNYRLRVSAEILLWASLFFGMIYLIGAQGFRRIRSGLPFIFSNRLFGKVLANGVLLLVAALLLSYIYYVSAKKKDKLNISSLVVFSLALNAPAFVAFVPSIVLDPYLKQPNAVRLAFAVMFIFLAGVLAIIRFAPVFKREKTSLYAKPMKHIVSALLCFWILLSLTSWDPVWMVISMAVIMLVLYFCGTEFASALPLLIFEIALVRFLADREFILGKDLFNIVITVAMLAQFAIGRLFYRKHIFSKKGVDYLSFMPLVMVFGLDNSDYLGMLVFLTIALMIFNFTGRTRIPARIVASIALIPAAAALISQPFINLSDVYMTEFILAVILADAAVIRFLIKPAEDVVLKYSWFGIVALCLTIEGISAAISGETFDLIVTGVSAGIIFLFSFIQKSRLWFILGVVSIIGIAIYLSATFWSSMAWLLYLLIAGIIMIVIAAGNEWRKRHSSEGRKLFKEWKW